ncbi:hypothetical protein [Mailhella sp.]|uniref:hypothetical protein n=1 Tax=Mailhella sp. TaxID=1981029 RepID=UPI004063AAD6
MNEIATQLDNEAQNESYIQLTITDTGWTDKERVAMRENGYDDMDMLRAWLS